MKRAKIFRYHVLGLLFWTAVSIGAYVIFCHVTLPSFLQSSAIADGLGLLVIPAGALLVWIVSLAERAIGGAYDEPTEWDELLEKASKDAKPQ